MPNPAAGRRTAGARGASKPTIVPGPARRSRRPPRGDAAAGPWSGDEDPGCSLSCSGSVPRPVPRPQPRPVPRPERARPRVVGRVRPATAGVDGRGRRAGRRTSRLEKAAQEHGRWTTKWSDAPTRARRAPAVPRSPPDVPGRSGGFRTAVALDGRGPRATESSRPAARSTSPTARSTAALRTWFPPWRATAGWLHAAPASRRPARCPRRSGSRRAPWAEGWWTHH